MVRVDRDSLEYLTQSMAGISERYSRVNRFPYISPNSPTRNWTQVESRTLKLCESSLQQTSFH